MFKTLQIMGKTTYHLVQDFFYEQYFIPDIYPKQGGFFHSLVIHGNLLGTFPPMPRLSQEIAGLICKGIMALFGNLALCVGYLEDYLSGRGLWLMTVVIVSPLLGMSQEVSKWLVNGL